MSARDIVRMDEKNSPEEDTTEGGEGSDTNSGESLSNSLWLDRGNIAVHVEDGSTTADHCVISLGSGGRR
jgi:hypothetical protein